MPGNEIPPVIPAQLSFLTIYNPALGKTDETLSDQIVFYSANLSPSRESKSAGQGAASDELKDGENEKLRQVGLAQGMVNFAKNFSDGHPMDCVETDKSRIVLHELEPSWWILASVDLTRLPLSPSKSEPPPEPDQPENPRYEYSSREVPPSELIRQQLLRVHSIFLLHHSTTLGDLYGKLSRPSFCILLDRFWTRFIWNWDILLHGNPAVDIFNATKLAPGGELGIGVGEEEWGSGEREVLEDFIYRTDGLADLVVSRFGDAAKTPDGAKPQNKKSSTGGGTYADNSSWVGTDLYPSSADGVVFSGVGAISKVSLAQVSSWMEWIYRYGEDAYGVKEDHGPARRRRRRKRHGPSRNHSRSKNRSLASSSNETQKYDLPPGIPPPLVRAAEPPAQLASEAPNERPSENQIKEESNSAFGTETFMKYLTLGYGASWGSSKSAAHPRVTSLRQAENYTSTPKDGDSGAESSEPEATPPKEPRPLGVQEQTTGRFIVGLRDDLENEDVNDDDGEGGDADKGQTSTRMAMRTIHVKMSSSAPSDTLEDEDRKLRVVVYLHQPFMFTFLFDPDTPSLAQASLYRSIHHQLGPLQKPLLQSTSPANVTRRVSEANSQSLSPDTTMGANPDAPLYDLLYDREAHTVRSSVPNIPEPGVSAALRASNSNASAQTPWTRLEALHVHSQILNTYAGTRAHPAEVERACKTSRGWWVVWMRLPDSNPNPTSRSNSKGDVVDGDVDSSTSDRSKEAFLVRKASDSPTYTHRGTKSGRFFSGFTGGSSSPLPGGSAAGGPGAGQLVGGVGLDARKYIESLLSLTR